MARTTYLALARQTDQGWQVVVPVVGHRFRALSEDTVLPETRMHISEGIGVHPDSFDVRLEWIGERTTAATDLVAS